MLLVTFEKGTAVSSWFLYKLLPHVRSDVQIGCVVRASHLWERANIALESLRNYVTFSVILQPL